MINNSVLSLKQDETKTIAFPCEDPIVCSSIVLSFPPGTYFIEAYGASGGAHIDGRNSVTTKRSTTSNLCEPQDKVIQFGGNTECKPNNAAGAGGYASGFITFHRITEAFINIGGKGLYRNGNVANSESMSERPPGGFNGGGYGTGYPSGSSGGGGATDIRIGKNDFYHRILVAGGGGGSDNAGAIAGKSDDGAGGCGGYPEGQGYWIDGNYSSQFISNQTFGFTFGNGESAMSGGSKNPKGQVTPIKALDRAGAGGGWFGGFSSHNGDGGAGGGSSFILSKTAIIPKGSISSCNTFFEKCESSFYAFSGASEFLFSMPKFADGIWEGNGQMKITLISSINRKYSCKQGSSFFPRNYVFLFFVVQALIKTT